MREIVTDDSDQDGAELGKAGKLERAERRMLAAASRSHGTFDREEAARWARRAATVRRKTRARAGGAARSAGWRED